VRLLLLSSLGGASLSLSRSLALLSLLFFTHARGRKNLTRRREKVGLAPRVEERANLLREKLQSPDEASQRGKWEQQLIVISTRKSQSL